MRQIDYLLRPALTSLTWTSINLDLYFTRANAGMADLNSYIDLLVDLKKERIDRYIDQIGESLLFDNAAAERCCFLSTLSVHFSLELLLA